MDKRRRTKVLELLAGAIEDVRREKYRSAYWRVGRIHRVLKPWKDAKLRSFYQLERGKMFLIEKKDVARYRSYLRRAMQGLPRKFTIRKSQRHPGKFVCVRTR